MKAPGRIHIFTFYLLPFTFLTSSFILFSAATGQRLGAAVDGRAEDFRFG